METREGSTRSTGISSIIYYRNTAFTPHSFFFHELPFLHAIIFRRIFTHKTSFFTSFFLREFGFCFAIARRIHFKKMINASRLLFALPSTSPPLRSTLRCGFATLLPACLRAAFGGGLFRFKSKYKVYHRTMLFGKLRHMLPHFFIFLLAIIMAVTVSANAVKQTEGVKFRWTPHTKQKYKWFSTKLNYGYDMKMTDKYMRIYGRIQTIKSNWLTEPLTW